LGSRASAPRPGRRCGALDRAQRRVSTVRRSDASSECVRQRDLIAAAHKLDSPFSVALLKLPQLEANSHVRAGPITGSAFSGNRSRRFRPDGKHDSDHHVFPRFGSVDLDVETKGGSKPPDHTHDASDGLRDLTIVPVSGGWVLNTRIDISRSGSPKLVILQTRKKLVILQTRKSAERRWIWTQWAG
jgi:hypothetical protein